MNTERILKVLKNERECIARQGDINKCKRHEHEGCLKCDLCLSDDEILEVYDFLINSYSMTEVHIKVSQEEADKLIEILNRNAQEGVRLAVLPYPDVGESYPTVTLETDEYGREHFKGICPYTNIKCEKWTCSVCEVEERERRFAKGDNGTKKCVDCEHALYLTKRDEELGIVGGCEIGFPCNEESEGTD